MQRLGWLGWGPAATLTIHQPKYGYKPLAFFTRQISRLSEEEPPKKAGAPIRTRIDMGAPHFCSGPRGGGFSKTFSPL